MQSACAVHSWCGHFFKKGPEVGISYVDGTVRGPIVLGEPGDAAPLLGVVTLEIL